jgi:hypothetical protein
VNWSSSWPDRTPGGGTGASRANFSAWAIASAHGRSGRSWPPPDSIGSQVNSGPDQLDQPSGVRLVLHPGEKVFDYADVSLTLFKERHMRTVLEDDKLGFLDALGQ